MGGTAARATSAGNVTHSSTAATAVIVIGRMTITSRVSVPATPPMKQSWVFRITPPYITRPRLRGAGTSRVSGFRNGAIHNSRPVSDRPGRVPSTFSPIRVSPNSVAR
ncbi:hypothetical protein DF053_34665 [Burkholderia cepacia]|nr:hypothetical protein DF053_34665 [Burkholderia cepacia]